MKNLKEILEGFKKEVGEMLISFGEKLTKGLTVEVDGIKKEVKDVKDELELLKAEIQDLKKAPMQTVEQPAVEPKKTTPEAKKPIQTKKESFKCGFTESQTATLVKKFIGVKEVFKTPIVVNGYMLQTGDRAMLKVHRTAQFDFEDGVYLINNGFIKDDNLSKELEDYKREYKDYKEIVFKTKEDKKIKTTFTNSEFKKILNAAEYSDKKNDSGRAINGVRVISKDNSIQVVGTDSYCMYAAKFEKECPEFAITIPYAILNKTKSELSKVKEIEFETDNKIIILKWSNRELMFESISENYPNTDFILKNAFEGETTADIPLKEIFNKNTLNEVKAYLKNTNANGVIVNLDTNKANIKVYNHKDKIGIKENLIKNIEVPVKYSGHKLEVALSLSLIEKHLSNFDTLGYKTASSMLFTVKDNIASIIMPIAIKSED